VSSELLILLLIAVLICHGRMTSRCQFASPTEDAREISSERKCRHYDAAPAGLELWENARDSTRRCVRDLSKIAERSRTRRLMKTRELTHAKIGKITPPAFDHINRQIPPEPHTAMYVWMEKRTLPSSPMIAWS
jgi:hypothetical protein